MQNYKKNQIKKGSQIIFQKELRNPDSPFTWRYVGARINPRRAQKIKKIVLFFVHSFMLILEKHIYFEKPQNFCTFN